MRIDLSKMICFNHNILFIFISTIISRNYITHKIVNNNAINYLFDSILNIFLCISYFSFFFWVIKTGKLESKQKTNCENILNSLKKTETRLQIFNCTLIALSWVFFCKTSPSWAPQAIFKYFLLHFNDFDKKYHFCFCEKNWKLYLLFVS